MPRIKPRDFIERKGDMGSNSGLGRHSGQPTHYDNDRRTLDDVYCGLWGRGFPSYEGGSGQCEHQSLQVANMRRFQSQIRQLIDSPSAASKTSFVRGFTAELLAYTTDNRPRV